MSKAVWASVIGFGIAALAVALALRLERTLPGPELVPAPQPVMVDVLRLTPAGDAVLAGRAAPDQDITLRLDDQPLAQTVSDHRGDWVAVPTAPLLPGLHQIQVQDGGAVLLFVPGQGDKVPAVAVLTGAAEQARLLLGASGPSGPVSLGLLACDPSHRCQISGQAVPRQQVRLLVDGTPIGAAPVDGQGAWSLPLAGSLLPHIQVELQNDRGRVLFRLPIRLPVLPEFAPVPQPRIVAGPGWWRLENGEGFYWIY